MRVTSLHGKDLFYVLLLLKNVAEVFASVQLKVINNFIAIYHIRVSYSLNSDYFNIQNSQNLKTREI